MDLKFVKESFVMIRRVFFDTSCRSYLAIRLSMKLVNTSLAPLIRTFALRVSTVAPNTPHVRLRDHRSEGMQLGGWPGGALAPKCPTDRRDSTARPDIERSNPPDKHFAGKASRPPLTLLTLT